MAGMMNGGANHLGVGERPSESHHWVPGMGWVFMPTYEEGNEASVQGAARNNNDAFQYEVDGESLADARTSGVTSYGSAQGYSLSPEVSAKIRARQASHDWYAGGMDHYGGPVDNGHEWRASAEDWLRERNGKPTISPWINTFDHDAENTFNRMREDNYNAFLGSEGRWVGDEQAGISELNGYNDNSIAAWFKEQFAGDDMVKHRREALRTLNGWNTQVRNPDYQSNMDRSEKWMNGQGHGIDKGTTRMSQRYFDEMGLAEKFGLTYNDTRPQEYADAYATVTGGGTGDGGTGGGFMDAYNSSRPRPSIPNMPTTGGPRPMGTPVHSVDVFPNGSMGGDHLDPFKVLPSNPNSAPNPIGWKGGDTGGPRPFGTMPAAPAGPQVKPGGFMESYLQKKAESKPSVMSLMTELKDA